jgi:hypothetical protein
LHKDFAGLSVCITRPQAVSFMGIQIFFFEKSFMGHQMHAMDETG